MLKQRDLVILAGAEQTKDSTAAFEQFRLYAESGGVYMKIGSGPPRYAAPGCNAYVVYKNHIVGVLKYAGVDYDFVPGDSLGGDNDPYTMDAGPALKFVGPFRVVEPQVPYRKWFRGWEYLPEDLRSSIKLRKPSVLRGVLRRIGLKASKGS